MSTPTDSNNNVTGGAESCQLPPEACYNNNNNVNPAALSAPPGFASSMTCGVDGPSCCCTPKSAATCSSFASDLSTSSRRLSPHPDGHYHHHRHQQTVKVAMSKPEARPMSASRHSVAAEPSTPTQAGDPDGPAAHLPINQEMTPPSSGDVLTASESSKMTSLESELPASSVSSSAAPSSTASSRLTTPRINTAELRSQLNGAVVSCAQKLSSPVRPPIQMSDVGEVSSTEKPGTPPPTMNSPSTVSQTTGTSSMASTPVRSTPRSPRPPVIRPAHHGCRLVGYRDQLHREQNVDGSPRSSLNSAAHDRQSRSVSPMHPLGGSGSAGDSSTAGGHRRWNFQAAAATDPRSVSPLTAANLIRSPSPDVARHVSDYKNCVTPDPEQVRPSRRPREDTYKRLFGKQSPRTGAQSQQARKQRGNAGDTYSTLFGPPPEERRRPATSNRDGNTHVSLFGPPPAFVARRNRSRYQDSPDLLSHDPRATGPQADKLSAVKGRYSLRHQDTGEKLFGEAEPRSTPPPPRVSGVFPLEVMIPAPPSPASLPTSQPPAEPVSQ